MKKSLLLFLTAFFVLCVTAQKKKDPLVSAPKTDSIPPAPPKPTKGPKKFEDIITDKAITKPGLFTVHKVEDKWYLEIPDSILGREIMAITRFSKVAGGGGVYGGEEANEQTIAWEKGPNNNLFLRVITTISVADSTTQIYKAAAIGFTLELVTAL